MRAKTRLWRYTRGKGRKPSLPCRRRNVELDLDEVEAEISLKFLAIGVFYSRKSYNPKYLFSDMLNAWRIPKFATVEKLGDYCFKMEFIKEEEKRRVIDGGPWCHKGDALIIVNYDGLTRPSEVRIDAIGLWVRFLGLPLAMMKECFAKQLGDQLGRYVKMDARCPCYLWVRLEFPLNKALQPSLTVKIKGRGAMVISLRFENMPHFCFHYGCVGHATINYEMRELDDHGVRFGEELRVSPPRHIREIAV
jgi:hypothetical protein